jgi:hypothetical protein
VHELCEFVGLFAEMSSLLLYRNSALRFWMRTESENSALDLSSESSEFGAVVVLELGDLVHELATRGLLARNRWRWKNCVEHRATNLESTFQKATLLRIFGKLHPASERAQKLRVVCDRDHHVLRQRTEARGEVRNVKAGCLPFHLHPRAGMEFASGKPARPKLIEEDKAELPRVNEDLCRSRRVDVVA